LCRMAAIEASEYAAASRLERGADWDDPDGGSVWVIG
jgi:hypothetical protein